MFNRCLLTTLAWLFTVGTGTFPPAFAEGKSAWKHTSDILSQEYLQGSMQGQSGVVLDMNMDGREDLVIGAPYARHKGANGVLLIYEADRRGSFGPSPSAVLEGDGNLGWSLAPLGSGSFAAGAISGGGENVSLSGTVEIYRSGNGRTARKAILEGERALDKFGYALASGDLNGDGTPDLIVGAPFHSPRADLYQQGAVYVYFGPDYCQEPSCRIKIPATSTTGGIGFSVAAGDIDGDGIDDLLMQATGRVVVYRGSESFAPAPDLPDYVYKSPSPTTDTDFGRSMAVLWNVDGNACRDVAIGASQAVGSTANAIDSGRLYVFEGCPAQAATPLLTKIEGEAACGHISGRFAYAVLPLADVSGDGVPDLAVSATHADGRASCPMTGRVFIFDGSKLTSPDPGPTENGIVMDIPGDVKDMHLGTFLAPLASGQRLVAGAPTEKANTGAIRLFRLR